MDIDIDNTLRRSILGCNKKKKKKLGNIKKKHTINTIHCSE